MKKIDAHLHIAQIIAGYCRRGELRAIGQGKAQWGNGETFQLLPERFGSDSFTIERAVEIMEEEGVAKAVLMQGSMYGFQNNYHLDILNKYGDRFCPSCTIDPFMTDYLQTMKDFIEVKKFKLAKFEMSSGGGLMGCHGTFSLMDEKMTKIYSILEENKATLALDIGDESMGSHQIDNLLDIATTFPKLKIVVCHLLAPSIDNLDSTYRKLEKLARANVYFDLAALPKIIAVEQYPYSGTAKIIKEASQIVGSDKLLWGSDAPYAAVGVSYSSLADYIVESQLFSKTELEDIFYNNADRVYFM